jgi:hypothetical protein
MAVSYKQKCLKCRKNWVSMSRGQRYAICYDCQKKDLSRKVKDPVMKKMFDIPEDYYRANSFLANIKMNYLRFDKLTDKQIDAFKKAVEKIKSDKKSE